MSQSSDDPGPKSGRGREPGGPPVDSTPATAARETGDRAAKARAAGLIGQVISGRYRIEAVAAMGGMGAVYRGEHLLMRKRVAIKILHPDIEGLPELVERFEREAIAGAHIDHPNVASATDFGQLDDGSYFLVLEYVRGVTLSEVIKRGPMPVERVVRIARQIASALQAVHDNGILHRDIKPRNIMLVEPSDVAKLVDFGLAKVEMDRLSTTGGDEARKPKFLTGAGVVFGTVAYLAPEVALGMHAVDERSDLYALGIVMYEMLAGRHPFDASNEVEMFRQHQKAKPPPTSERTPGVEVPPAIEAVMMRLLAKSPLARYQAAEELIAALDEALAPPLPSLPPAMADEPAPPTAPSAPAPQKAKAAVGRGSRSRLLIVVAGIGLVLALVLAWMAGSSDDGVKGDRAPRSAAPPAPTTASAPIPKASAVAPPPSTAAPPKPRIEIDGLRAPAWRTRLLKAPGAKDWQQGGKAVAALAELDIGSFRDRKIVSAASAVAVGLAREGGAAADALFDLLSMRLGQEGLDVLYDAVESRGGTPGAKRAAALLRQAEILARATPALRIAFELRDGSCGRKRELLERALKEGDERTLRVLMELQNVRCSGDDDPCCFKRSKPFQDAITELRARL